MTDEPDVATVQVTASETGQRVDHVLVAHLGHHTRSQIQRLIKDGCVRIADKAVRAATTVRAGEVVTVSVPTPVPAKPRAQALPLEIVYDDADLVVVDKPAGMVVHPAAGHADGTLVNALLHHVHDLSGVGGELRPGIVHRLDRGTSGLMVIAKHDRAHRSLAQQFRERDVDKRYAALVWGVVQAGRRIDLPLGRDPVNRKKISTRARRARAAVTRITRAEHLKGVSLLEVAIATGRTHQIRVHLSAIGHPIVGDSVYGGTRRHAPRHVRGVQRLERPFLHAAYLSFRHPSDNREIVFQSPLPEDLQAVLNELKESARRDEARLSGR